MADVPFMTVSLLVAILNIAPFLWQLEHRNSGPIALGFWTIILNLSNFVNAFVWRNDVIDKAPVLCDILIKIQTYAPIGSVCGNVCIARYLALVVSPSSGNFNKKERRRIEIQDYLICFGIPIVLGALQILIQPTRYGIVKSIGCGATSVLSWPTYICWIIWFPLISVIGCFLFGYVIYRLYVHRRDFRKLLNQSNSALSTSRFIRLSLLGVCSIIFNIIYSTIAAMGARTSSGHYVDYNWDFVHSEFSYIFLAPNNAKASFGNWGGVFAGIMVLIFFGFASEANAYYGKLAKLLGLQTLYRQARKSFQKPGAALSSAQPIELHRVHLSNVSDEEKITPHWHSGSINSEHDGPFQLMARGASEHNTRSPMQIEVTREARIV